jgi:hypothetical protein
MQCGIHVGQIFIDTEGLVIRSIFKIMYSFLFEFYISYPVYFDVALTPDELNLEISPW